MFAVAGRIQPPIQFLQRREFRGRLINFLGELFAVGIIARVLKRHQKRRQLALGVHVQRGQLLFQRLNAHNAILLPNQSESTQT